MLIATVSLSRGAKVPALLKRGVISWSLASSFREEDLPNFW